MGLIKKICGTEVKNDPWVCLFHCTNGPRKKYRSSLVPYLLNGAKVVIPRNWMEENAPSVAEWIREVGRMEEMEKLLAIQYECWERYEEIWRGWREFRGTEIFREAIAS